VISPGPISSSGEHLNYLKMFCKVQFLSPLCSEGLPLICSAYITRIRCISSASFCSSWNGSSHFMVLLMVFVIWLVHSVLLQTALLEMFILYQNEEARHGVHVCNPSTGEAEAVGSQVWGKTGWDFVSKNKANQNKTKQQQQKVPTLLTVIEYMYSAVWLPVCWSQVLITNQI
jgi:hypothetical protein